MIFILFSYLYLTDSSSLTTNSQTTPTTPSSPLSPETVNIVVVVVVVASFIVGFAIAVAVYLSSQVPGVSQAASIAPSAFVSAARKPTGRLRHRQNMAPEIYAAYSSWNPFHVSRMQVPWYTPRRARWADININESNTDLDLAFRDTSAVNRRKRIWRPMNQLDLRPSVDYFGYRLG